MDENNNNASLNQASTTPQVSSAPPNITRSSILFEVINIDHPFLFLIRDKNNDTVWFIGAVYEPNLWADDASSYKPQY